MSFTEQICHALEATSSTDNQKRMQGEQFIQQAQQHQGCLQTLLTIVMSPEEVAKVSTGMKGDEICLRAVSLLKTVINVSWGMADSPLDKENKNPQQFGRMDIAQQDRDFIKANIFQALTVANYTLQNKKIASELENIFYNIAQTDFESGHWPACLQEITARLQSQDEATQMIGIQTLKELIRAFQYEDTKILLKICEQVYPALSNIMQNIISTSGPNQLKIMALVARIFYMSNQMKLLSFLYEQGQLQMWINIFVAILDSQQDPSSELVQLTNDQNMIDQLDNSEWWKLKGICCKISVKLLQRCNDKKNKDVLDIKKIQQLHRDFQNEFLQKLVASHTSIILSKQGQFVGTKALALSIKFVQMSLKFKQTRMYLEPYIEKILFELSLPMFMTSQKDMLSFQDDPIEYIRLQVDHGNELNIKKQLSNFVDKLCSLKKGKKGQQQTAKHLEKYMQTIYENLGQLKGAELETEALLYAFGNLSAKCQFNGLQMYQNVQAVLETYVYPCLESQNPLLQARACWVYGRYSQYDFTNKDHLTAAIDKIIQHLYSPYIVVKVDAALALSELLDHHELAANLVRPGLGDVLKVYLKIMDQIDFEELVSALRKIVDIFEDEIAPYAVSLCIKLSEAFNRLISQKGKWDDEDTEAGLTADGLMTAIRRVLNSISGKLPELYPQLETILEQSLYLSLSEEGSCSTDEGLTCVSELVYNQQVVSGRMWGIFGHICKLYLNNSGVIDTDNVAQASAPLINFMAKDPNTFKSGDFGGQTPLDLLFAFIQKIFTDGKEIGDEIHSMCAVTLIMAILEHLGDGIQTHIHTINSFYLQELNGAETKDYKNMLIQGLMMNFWYDQTTTLQSLQSSNALDQVFDFVLQNVNSMMKDFEIKRLIIGLSTLTLSLKSSQLDQSVQSRFPAFMQAILYLCQKSLEIRAKKQKKKEDEAQEDKSAEAGVIYDEDDENEVSVPLESEDEEDSDWSDSDDEFENELYDNKLDKVDDILFVKEKLDELQKNDPQHFQNIQSCLDQQSHEGLKYFFDQAAVHKQQMDELDKQWEAQKLASKQDVQQIDLSN